MDAPPLLRTPHGESRIGVLLYGNAFRHDEILVAVGQKLVNRAQRIRPTPRPGRSAGQRAGMVWARRRPTAPTRGGRAGPRRDQRGFGLAPRRSEIAFAAAS